MAASVAWPGKAFGSGCCLRKSQDLIVLRIRVAWGKGLRAKPKPKRAQLQLRGRLVRLGLLRQTQPHPHGLELEPILWNAYQRHGTTPKPSGIGSGEGWTCASIGTHTKNISKYIEYNR